MKSSAKKVELAPYDDLFSTEESRQDAKLEKVREIPLSELHPFKNHPFKVKDDEAMMETADSVRQYGVLVPAIARPDPEGGYRKAGYSKKFREEHEEEILLHQAAKNAFDDMGVKKLPKVKELQTEYAQLLEEKKKTYAEYRRSREEMRELLAAKANVDRLLNMEAEHDTEREKDHEQR